MELVNKLARRKECRVGLARFRFFHKLSVFSLRAAVVAAVAAVLFSGGALIRSMTVPELSAYVPLRCVFNWLTGYRCPTCGLGRSLLHAAAGSWSAAWAYHPLGPLALVAGAGTLGLWLLSPTLAKRFGAEIDELLRAASSTKLVVVIAMLYASWSVLRSFPLG